MKTASLLVAVIVGIACSASAQTAGPVVTPVARTHTTITGQPIVVPANPDVVVSIATFPPGSKIVEHKHPFPHLVYVMAGTLTVTNTETGKTFDAKEGAFVAEMEDTWHYGVNNGTVPVKLLVIDEVPQGTKTNVVPRNPP
jgi:quercetin dioxygenase-like cupin family protein